MRGLVVFLCSVLVVWGVSAQVYAGPTPAVGFTDDSNTLKPDGDVNWAVGFTFVLTSNITVTHLGVYDYGEPGFGLHDDDADEDNEGSSASDRVDTRRVAIYEYAALGEMGGEGDRIALATVSSDDPLEGFFRYTRIEDLALEAETKYLVAAINGWEPFAYDPDGFYSAGEVDFLGGHYVNPPLLGGYILVQNIETSSFSENFEPSAFGGNFKYEVTNVPVPSSLILLISGIFSLAAIRKGRR